MSAQTTPADAEGHVEVYRAEAFDCAIGPEVRISSSYDDECLIIRREHLDTLIATLTELRAELSAE